MHFVPFIKKKKNKRKKKGESSYRKLYCLSSLGPLPPETTRPRDIFKPPPNSFFLPHSLGHITQDILHIYKYKPHPHGDRGMEGKEKASSPPSFCTYITAREPGRWWWRWWRRRTEPAVGRPKGKGRNCYLDPGRLSLMGRKRRKRTGWSLLPRDCSPGDSSRVTVPSAAGRGADLLTRPTANLFIFFSFFLFFSKNKPRTSTLGGKSLFPPSDPCWV